MAERDPLDTLHLRVQSLCIAAGIENFSQLAVAIARFHGDQSIASGLSLTGPHAWWKGNRKPTLRNTFDILAVTGGSADWLIMNRGPMFAVSEAVQAKIQRTNRKLADDAAARSF
jgi:hypothetical protein